MSFELILKISNPGMGFERVLQQLCAKVLLKPCLPVQALQVELTGSHSNPVCFPAGWLLQMWLFTLETFKL